MSQRKKGSNVAIAPSRKNAKRVQRRISNKDSRSRLPTRPLTRHRRYGRRSVCFRSQSSWNEQNQRHDKHHQFPHETPLQQRTFAITYPLCVIPEQSEESRILDARLFSLCHPERSRGTPALRRSISSVDSYLARYFTGVPLAHDGLVAERRGREGSPLRRSEEPESAVLRLRRLRSG